MKTRTIFRLLLISLFVSVGLLVWTVVTPVHAECGSQPPSSCSTCHEQEDPVSDKGEWHIIHASKDICTNCHGGNGSAMEKDLAHENLVTQPLSDIYTDCHSCHTDYQTHAEIFAAYIGITPESCSTPTPVPVGYSSSQPPSSAVSLPAASSPGPLASHGFLFGIAMLLGLVFFIVGVIWLDHHKISF